MMASISNDIKDTSQRQQVAAAVSTTPISVTSNAAQWMMTDMNDIKDIPGSERQFLVSQNCTAGDLLTKLAAMQGILSAEPSSPPPRVSLVAWAPGEMERHVLAPTQMLRNFASLSGPSVNVTLRIHDDQTTKNSKKSDEERMIGMFGGGFAVVKDDPEAPKTPPPVAPVLPRETITDTGFVATGEKKKAVVNDSGPGVATVCFGCMLLGSLLALTLLMLAPGGPVQGGAPAGHPTKLIFAVQEGDEMLDSFPRGPAGGIPEAEKMVAAQIRRLSEAGGEATVADKSDQEAIMLEQQLGDLQKKRKAFGLASASFRRALVLVRAKEAAPANAYDEISGAQASLRRQRGELLFKLGVALYESGLTSEAEEALKEAQTAQESDTGAGVLHLAATLHQLGNVKRDEGETDTAMELYNEAKSLQAQQRKPTDNLLTSGRPEQPLDLNEEASLRVDMGHAEAQRGDTKAAEDQFEKAWVMLRKRLHTRREAETPLAIVGTSEKTRPGEGFVESGAPSATSGGRHEEEGSSREADDEAWERAVVLTSLGAGLREMGKYAASKSALEAAAALQRRNGGQSRDPATAAETLTQMSRVYRDEGETDRALKLALEAAELLEKLQEELADSSGGTGGDLAWTLASTYAAAADMLREAQRLRDAKAYGERAMASLDALPVGAEGDRSIELGRAALQKVLGQVAHDAQLLDLAIAYYERALELQAKWAGKDSPREMADTYNLLGTAHQDRGDLQEALKAYTANLKYQEEQKGGAVASVDLCAAYNNMATVLMRMGEQCEAKPLEDECQPAWLWVDEAVSVLEEAVATGEKAELPAQNPELQAVRENLEIAKEKQSTLVKPDEAELQKAKTDASSPTKEQAGSLRSAWRDQLVEGLAPATSPTAA